MPKKQDQPPMRSTSVSKHPRDPEMPRFAAALALATEAHAGQVRKGTENVQGFAVPYITHPVAVSALVVRYGGDEDQAIAALLHDVLEDGGPQWAAPILERFGPRVLAMVEACTDGVPDASGHKPPWKERKVAYLAHLAESSDDALLVSACDKLSNLQAILLDLIEVGDSVWSRFTGGKEGSLWYYASLVECFSGRVPALLETALQRDLATVQQQAGPVRVRQVEIRAWEKCTAWLRAFSNGSMEFELYDRGFLDSDRADMFGFGANDVILMARELGSPIDSPSGTASKLLDAILARFDSWGALMAWVKSIGVSPSRSFDPWA